MMNMTEDLKLSKFENEPWGFRITGGKDFGTMLAVIKVAQGSLAEAAGMKVGDMLIAINGEPLTNLTHEEAHEVIIKAGNNFMLTVVRGSLVVPPPLVKNPPFPEYSESINFTQASNEHIQDNCILHENYQSTINTCTEEMNTLRIEIQDHDQVEEELENISRSKPTTPERQLSSPIPEIHVTPPPPAGDTLISDPSQILLNDEVKPMTEEELQNMMLERSEIVSGNALGVDFYKLGPKCEIIQKSEVLQALKEEKIEQAKKKISAFLQQPNRPKVKPKIQDEAPKNPPYKPVIIIPKKQQAQSQVQEEQQIQVEQQTQEEQKVQGQEEEVHENKNDTEHQSTTEVESKENETECEEQKTEQGETRKETENDEQLEIKEDSVNVTRENEQNVDIDDSSIESQLFKVQQQLANLLQMPHQMQQQLTNLQEQLTKIIQQKAALEVQETVQSTEEVTEAEQTDTEKKEDKPEADIEKDTPSAQHEDMPVQETESNLQTSENIDSTEESKSETINPNEQTMDDVQNTTDTIEEKEDHVEIQKPRRDIKWQKDSPPKNKPFFPLTPKPRPVILPGGAPLSPNDELFSEDFIAETLSGNAEVILGKAIGVNFHKFQKSYDHLKASSVYQMIQNNENQQSIFPTRERKIASKEDYIACAKSATGEEIKSEDQ